MISCSSMNGTMRLQISDEVGVPDLVTVNGQTLTLDEVYENTSLLDQVNASISAPLEDKLPKSQEWDVFSQAPRNGC